VLAALQRDALRRAGANPLTAAAAGRITLIEADATTALADARGFDAAYLDPMYPDDGKRALPGKEMQVLRDLTGGDADAAALLHATLASGVARIAVKRPASAPWLAGVKPNVSLDGTQARFDLYLA
jgi:16S rRNA (guanine1516-N2)-methyltransferase